MDLKTLRISRHLSQEDLAEISGLNVRTIQRIENGRKPSIETLKRLASALEIDPSLISTANSMNKSDKPTKLGKSKFTSLFSKPIFVATDAISIGTAFFLAMFLRFGPVNLNINNNVIVVATVTAFLSVAVFYVLKLYSNLKKVSYTQLILRIIIAVLLSASVVVACLFFTASSIPRSVPIIYAFIVLFGLVLPRLLYMTSLKNDDINASYV